MLGINSQERIDSKTALWLRPRLSPVSTETLDSLKICNEETIDGNVEKSHKISPKNLELSQNDVEKSLKIMTSISMFETGLALDQLISKG